ncbi:MAG TPA: UDP-3-O-(3-hydroxymyristoyl)glucosamine N-acyltransferase [Candidatus Hydrogenedentes bacterium]|nr:UDP-3-O-(3-hydroxymyristoyl)glucosamine N-acyltransferase [Candidatus Hydrogenedentota bacterium]
MKKSVGEIAELVGGEVWGDREAEIVGLNGIEQAQPGELTFLNNTRYARFLEATGATAILAPPEVVLPGKTFIHVKNPYIAFVMVLNAWSEPLKPCLPEGVHPTAIIGKGVTLGDHAAIGPYVVVGDDCVIGSGVMLYQGVSIGAGCTIGEGSVLYPNVVVRERVSIGARCIIHAGAVIGSDGFGFAPLGGTWFKIPQVGTVIIGDDVEIGSNTAIDRATFGRTVIGRGTKIDNLVQVGHNVQIGEHCVVSGMTGIAGSAIIGNHVTIAAQVGIADHVEVGEGATLGARAAVGQSVKPGAIMSGHPLMEHRDDLRVLTALRRLPDMPRRMRDLERRIQELEEKLHGTAENDK